MATVSVVIEITTGRPVAVAATEDDALGWIADRATKDIEHADGFDRYAVETLHLVERTYLDRSGRLRECAMAKSDDPASDEFTSEEAFVQWYVTNREHDRALGCPYCSADAEASRVPRGSYAES